VQNQAHNLLTKHRKNKKSLCKTLSGFSFTGVFANVLTHDGVNTGIQQKNGEGIVIIDTHVRELTVTYLVPNWLNACPMLGTVAENAT
jgi:hypothetical protein